MPEAAAAGKASCGCRRPAGLIALHRSRATSDTIGRVSLPDVVETLFQRHPGTGQLEPGSLPSGSRSTI
jgi:hypothetical protein